MSTRTIGISDALYDYLLSVSVPPDALWERLRDETREAVGYNMQISPEQGQFMSLLVKMLGVKNALEVGTFTGYSALCVARALPDEGKVIACDVSEEWTSIARKYWQEAGVENKIELRLGPALDTLDAMVDDGGASSFDFAFLACVGSPLPAALLAAAPVVVGVAARFLPDALLALAALLVDEGAATAVGVAPSRSQKGWQAASPPAGSAPPTRSCTM